MAVKERIKKILEGLNEGIFEKEEVIKLSLLSAIAGESIFLLGLPGVAKSLIARRLKFAFKDAKSFEYLMNRFSTPDEIFGPISVVELQKDNYKRITEHYLPDAHIVFLDEIWKAGSSIQNTLLTVLNEKIFRNGKEIHKVPLRGLIAASNELPAEAKELVALWDRFLIRYVVQGVEDSDNFNRMISDDLDPNVDNVQEKITDKEYLKWTKEINQLKIPDEVYKVIDIIRKKIQEHNNKLDEDKKEIILSDRRWRKIVRILRTSAFLNDRVEVDLMDCFLIQYCIWNEEEEIGRVKDVVVESIREYGYIYEIDIKDLENEIETLKNDVEKETNLKIPKEKIVNKEYHNSFYKLIGLQTLPQYCLIKKEDFLKISTVQVAYNMFDINGQNPRGMTIYNKGEAIMVADSDWSNCHVETTVETEIEIQKKKPNPKLMQTYDQEVRKIILQIEMQIKEIEDYLTKKSESLETNIFANHGYSKIIFEKLNNRILEFKNLILEVEKIKAYYDELE